MASSQPYLPPGWTEEMYRNPQDYEDEYEALPDDQYALINKRRLQEAGIDLDDTDVTGQPDEPAPCVQAVREGSMQEWGFVIIRTVYDVDSEAWARFKRKWDDLVDDQLTSKHGSGIDTIRDSLRWHWAEDRQMLDGVNFDAARDYFNEIREGSDFPQDLDLSMFLVLDRASFDSILNFSAQTFQEDTPLNIQRQNAPWITAVDAEYGSSEDEEENEDEWKGHVKVAVESLLNELFPALAMGYLPPENLIPTTGDVWFEPYDIGS